MNKKYVVFDSGLPATCPVLGLEDNQWDNNKFDSFNEAKNYLISWMGFDAPKDIDIELGRRYYYGESGEDTWVEINYLD